MSAFLQILMDQALARHREGRLADAAGLYREILKGDPAHRDARHMLGVIYAQTGREDEGRALLAQVVAETPGDALVRVNYGNVLNALRLYPEALAQFDAAITIAPDHAEAQQMRGKTLHILERYDDALAAYDSALAIDPGNALAFSYRGVVLQNLKRLDEALASFQNARALAPGMAEAALNESFCHLLKGDFARGLPLYELRKQMPQPFEARNYPQPLWTGGQDIRGKTLFCYIEQGLGDAIQFYRFVRFAVDLGARVVLSVQDPLVRLLSRAEPQVSVIGAHQVPEQFDFHIPLPSIPLAAGMTVDTIPAPDHYLTAEPDRIARWKARLGDHGMRIGIAWRGREMLLGEEGKSFPLAAAAPLAQIPGVRLIALQKNAGTEQLADLPPGMTVEHFDDFDDGPDAFLDTAAIMTHCDLVISADSSPAHLAGALGRPCWVALKHVPDWRWFLGRDDTPWYPHTRLFRQPRAGDWRSAFEAMASELTSDWRRS